MALLAYVAFSQSLPPRKPTALGPTKPLSQAGVHVIAMADEALRFAYPKRRSAISFYEGRFSRDGRLIALVLGGIKTSDFEEVWIYEMASKQLTQVTNPQDASIIHDLAWSEDGILYVKAMRQRPFFIAATPGQARETDRLPPEMADVFSQRSKNLHFGVDCCLEQNDRYAVRVIGEAHNYCRLFMRELTSKEWKQITRGGPELLTFLFDPNRSRILYPDNGKIVSFDLQTGQYHSLLTLKNPENPYLLDQTPDGRTIAYVERGACLWDTQPADQLRIEQPAQVCFVEAR